jgi:CheY-like chemotaxis protein
LTASPRAATESQVEPRERVLIVDGDKVSQRAIELALAAGRYDIRWARDGQAALDLMRRARVDLVVADSLLADMPGITLMRRTVELCGAAAPTFVFVSADRANTTRIGLLMLGAHDYLVKPFVPDELRLRVRNTLEARRRARVESLCGVTGLAGDASLVPVPDVLTMLELTRKSGVLHVSVGDTVGRIIVVGGRLAHAEVGELLGDDAFFILVRYHAGLYRFEPGVPDGSDVTIDRPVSELLLTSAAREDDAQQEWLQERFLDATISTTSASLRELGVGKSSLDLRSRAPAEALDAPALRELTSRLRVTIADRAILGDLVLVEQIPASPSLFRIELWSPLASGVVALLSLASQPGVHLVAAALRSDARRLHLQFEAPSASIVVSLVDLESPLEPPASEPHGIILVPPRGDFVLLAPQRLTEICGRVDRPHRPVIVTLGGPALRSMIARLVGDDSQRARHLGLAGELADPRDAIGQVIELWSTSR